VSIKEGKKIKLIGIMLNGNSNKAGPGHIPTNPQPIPKRALPNISLKSILELFSFSFNPF
jgi:hypothetical protein